MQLPAHVADALDDGDHRQPGEHVDGRLEQFDVEDAGALREHQPGRQDHHAHGAVGDADLALDAERLGAGARVGDHQRGEHGDDDGGDRERRRRLGELEATAVSTMPSSMRSSVESRNAPNGVPLPDMRE